MIPHSNPKPIFPVLALLAILSVLVVPASAGITLTFSDLDLTQNQKVLIYDPLAPAGTALIGEYNTTDSVILENGTAYVIAFKPSEQVWFQNPLNAIELLKVSIPVWASFALVLMALFGGFFVFYAIFIRRR